MTRYTVTIMAGRTLVRSVETDTAENAKAIGRFLYEEFRDRHFAIDETEHIVFLDAEPEETDPEAVP